MPPSPLILQWLASPSPHARVLGVGAAIPMFVFCEQSLKHLQHCYASKRSFRSGVGRNLPAMLVSILQPLVESLQQHYMTSLKTVDGMLN